jgi:hypothetical protein
VISVLYLAVGALLLDRAERRTGWERLLAAGLGFVIGMTGIGKAVLWIAGVG